jgi:hypothetical protein
MQVPGFDDPEWQVVVQALRLAVQGLQILRLWLGVRWRCKEEKQTGRK